MSLDAKRCMLVDGGTGKREGSFRSSDILTNISFYFSKNNIYLCSRHLGCITNHSQAPSYGKQPFKQLMNSEDQGTTGTAAYAPHVWGLKWEAGGGTSFCKEPVSIFSFVGHKHHPCYDYSILLLCSRSGN